MKHWMASQLRRDFAILVLFISAIFWYWHNLNIYLFDLINPRLLMVGFLGSFLFALMYDI